MFLSRVDVARGEMLEAVRAVLGSALSPAVVAYLAQHGLASDNLGFAVLIHEFIEGEAAGAAAFDPTRPEPPTVEVQAGKAASIENGARARIEEAVRALAATHGAVELEWVASGGKVTFLQLRPLHAPARTAARPVVALPSFDPLSAANDRDLNDTDWHWDAAHNPLPLSPAQAGLVSLVDEQCKIGLRQRVVGGYLFYATDPTLGDDADRRRRRPARRVGGGAPAPRAADADAGAGAGDVRGDLPAAVRRRAAELARRDRRAGRVPAPQRLRSRRRCCPSCCRACRRRRPSGRGARARWRRRLIRSCARRRSRATWRSSATRRRAGTSPRRPGASDRASLERLMRGTNVGAPIDDRSWREAADAVRARLPEDVHAEWESRLTVARRAAAVAEDDDALYARLQAHVRRALLREGERLWASGVLADPNEVFWLPLEAVAQGRARRGAARLRGGGAGADRRAQRRRRGAQPIRRRSAPLTRWTSAPTSCAGVPAPRARASAPCASTAATTNTTTTASTCWSRARCCRPSCRCSRPRRSSSRPAACSTTSPPRPANAPIPTVVGAVGACRALRDGDQVLVDGGAGLVVRLA